ncbi:hypothetical protein INR49_024862, partial [Caranx melampygus]
MEMPKLINGLEKSITSSRTRVMIFKCLGQTGTAGLARQSPALPRRETSTRWRRRYLKASAITRMASWRAVLQIDPLAASTTFCSAAEGEPVQ